MDKPTTIIKYNRNAYLVDGHRASVVERLLDVVCSAYRSKRYPIGCYEWKQLLMCNVSKIARIKLGVRAGSEPNTWWIFLQVHQAVGVSS